MPRAGEGELELQLSLPPDAPLERTEGAVRNIEAFLLRNFSEQLEHVYSRIGAAGLSGSASSLDLDDEGTASIRVLIDDASGLAAEDLIAALGPELDGLPEISTRFAQQETALETSLGRTAAPVQVEIKGKDLSTLSRLAEEVRQRLSAISDLTGVRIEPDRRSDRGRTAAARRGGDRPHSCRSARHRRRRGRNTARAPPVGETCRSAAGTG